MYTRNINLDVDMRERFEPGMFSIPELHFLVDHLGEPPVAALHDFEPQGKHKGVIRARIESILHILYELGELEKHRGVAWAGLDAVKESAIEFLEWHERCTEIKRRGGPANPSMYHWDDLGKPFKYAIGSDSGEMVRTQILDDGSRKPFGVVLRARPEDVLKADLKDLMPWTKGKTAEIRADKLILKAKGRMGIVECPICGKTEEFDSADRTKKMMAMNRMAKHLKTAKQETGRHRLLYTKEYR